MQYLNNTLVLVLLVSLIATACQNTDTSSEGASPKVELPAEVASMEIPFFVDRDSLANPLKLRIVKVFQGLNFPQNDYPDVEGSWSYSSGNPANGLKVSIGQRPRLDSVVESLPHEVFKPRSTMWYSKEISVTEPSLLRIEADDGAQVFQNGQLIYPVLGDFYPVNPKPEPIRIDIRVLNNSMTGGLKKVEMLTESEFSTRQRAIFLEIMSKKLVRQAVNARSLNKGMADEVITALQTQTPDALRAPERFFAPLLIDPFLQKTGFAEYTILYERSTATSTKLDWMDTQRQIPNRFLCEQRNDLLCEVRTDLFEPGILYEVEVSDSRAKSIFNMKAPTNQLSYSFSVWGDSENNWEVFRQLTQQMGETQDAFTVGLGDLVNDGAKKENWLDFFATLAPITNTTPLYMIPGNQDYKGFYNDLIPIPFISYLRNNNQNRTYYSWRATYAAFIVLDPNKNFPAGIDQEQGEWLEEQLASEEWRSADWRFLLIHQPPYAQGRADYHGDTFIKNIIDGLAEPARIDFVLSGHSHDYERLTKTYGSQKTTFLVMGGAGGRLNEAASSEFPQMDVVKKEHHFGRFFLEDEKIALKVYNLQGDIIDQFERTR